MTGAAHTALILAALLTTPATTFPLQTVIESDAPRDPDLILADEPLVRIGVLDGQMEYIFGNITGAIRMENGSVVVADESIFEVRMYDAAGRHVWTSGRYGEGPGEYKGLRLLRGCPGAAITVFDWYLDRITELGLDGSVADTRTLAAAGVNPYQDLACSPGGDLVFQPWPKVILDRTVAAGEHYRWEMVLNRVGDEGVVTLRSGIPGAERTNLSAGSRPRMWGRKMVFAVAPAGVWYGSGDDYELEHVDWAGSVTRITRWAGPDLEVTREHLDRYRDALLARYDEPAERRRFEREGWPDIRDGLPERFPAYDALVPLPDGSVWVVPHPWMLRNELHLLDPDGVWLRRLTIPVGSTVLDAGPDWVLLLQRGELDEQSVAVYEAGVSF